MISARTRKIAAWRGVRTHRWRFSIRNSTPCSFSEMGYGSLSGTRCTTSACATSSS